MALLLTAELLSFSPQSQRANKVLDVLLKASQAAGVQAKQTNRYQGGSDLLVLWGPGEPARFEPMRKQVEAGGHTAALDLSYWHRESKFRVSIDAAHPQAWVMRKDWPADRWKADAVPVCGVWDENGPVLVAGIGSKARVQYGAGVVDAWEASMMRQVRAAGRTVLYRGKKEPNQPVIEKALRGVSCLITYHSNVAVDAIRMGIPVVCHDGAAAAVCWSKYSTDLRPLSEETRLAFLRNLAWFQWRNDEAAGVWGFLREALA